MTNNERKSKSKLILGNPALHHLVRRRWTDVDHVWNTMPVALGDLSQTTLYVVSYDAI